MGQLEPLLVTVPSAGGRDLEDYLTVDEEATCILTHLFPADMTLNKALFAIPQPMCSPTVVEAAPATIPLKIRIPALDALGYSFLPELLEDDPREWPETTLCPAVMPLLPFSRTVN